tara:strand:+ start:1807 stop:2796 length:990 start_codon:yes stop_codon:yes gene_type:complete
MSFITKMTATTKINNLVKSVFGEAEDFEGVWTKNTKVQQQLKSIVNNGNAKAVKDPNAPKRGKSSYLFFCGDMREKVKEKLGDEASATNITKELGQMWNTMKNSGKSNDKSTIDKYQKMADTDKVRYEAEKADYVPSEEFENANVKGRRRKKDPNAPKRAKSAYLFFCNEERELVKKDHPDFKATETTAELGARWNTLKGDSSRSKELEKYEKMAADDKVRYQKETSKTSDATSEQSSVVDKSVESKKPVVKKAAAVSSKKKALKKSDVVETKQLNGYQGFCQNHREQVKKDHPKESAKDITKRLATMWKNLSVDEQTQWKQGLVCAGN